MSDEPRPSQCEAQRGGPRPPTCGRRGRTGLGGRLLATEQTHSQNTAKPQPGQNARSREFVGQSRRRKHGDPGPNDGSLGADLAGSEDALPLRESTDHQGPQSEAAEGESTEETPAAKEGEEA